jgi:hypothetical protein
VEPSSSEGQSWRGGTPRRIAGLETAVTPAEVSTAEKGRDPLTIARTTGRVSNPRSALLASNYARQPSGSVQTDRELYDGKSAAVARERRVTGRAN